MFVLGFTRCMAVLMGMTPCNGCLVLRVSPVVVLIAMVGV
jgi:hypothetical protein